MHKIQIGGTPRFTRAQVRPIYAIARKKSDGSFLLMEFSNLREFDVVSGDYKGPYTYKTIGLCDARQWIADGKPHKTNLE